MLRITFDERDCTPIEEYTTEELREEYMQLDLDIGRMTAHLDLLGAELKRRDEDVPARDDEDEDNPPDPEADEDYPFPDDDDDRSEFADPGGNSALRAATPSNPRNLPCPTCGEPNRLTPKDVALGYQCNTCADKLERGCD